MLTNVLADAGPIVAIYSERDASHAIALEQSKEIGGSLITTWAVVAEAAWLLRSQRGALFNLFDACASGAFLFPTLDQSVWAWIKRFCRRYENLNPQLADATLVYLAEREGWDTVFT